MKKYILFAVLSFLMMGANNFRAEAQTNEKPKLNVAILIFDGVQIIDYTGPYEVLGSWSRRKVFTVAEKPDVVTTNMGMKVVPNYSFENHPKIDVLVIPGGGNSTPGANGRGVGKQLTNETVIKWIQDNARDAKYVLSVCNGAFLIAKAGLLENLEATTTAGMITDLKTFAPTVKLVYDHRFVDNGKIITTAGLSSGIDGALHLVEKLDGKGWAKNIALSIEYNWQPDSDYTRASLADTKFPNSIGEVFAPYAEPLDFNGGKDVWEEKWLVKTALTATQLQEEINKKWETEANWAKLKADKSGVVWKLTEKDGKIWNGQASVEPSAESGKLILTLKMRRNQ
jgi:putative intracellular protease/amidase